MSKIKKKIKGPQGPLVPVHGGRTMGHQTKYDFQKLLQYENINCNYDTGLLLLLECTFQYTVWWSLVIWHIFGFYKTQIINIL